MKLIYTLSPGHAVSEDIDEERARRMAMMQRGMQDRALNQMLGEGGTK